MSNPRPAAAASALECWACVCAHGLVIRYRRIGAGRTVLVLRDAERSDPAWATLTDALAARFRVIVPDALPSDAAECLSGFLEGLGVAGVGVVAGDGFHGTALDLARIDPFRAARVVLVTNDASANELDGVDALVVPLERAADRALPWVARYLDDETTPRTG